MAVVETTSNITSTALSFWWSAGLLILPVFNSPFVPLLVVGGLHNTAVWPHSPHVVSAHTVTTEPPVRFAGRQQRRRSH